MGCDYYIYKDLNIYYNDNKYISISLERDRGYYNDIYDEDEEDYEEKMKKYIKECLTPVMKPIIIYIDNNFKNINFENKYKHLIENEINKYNIKWCEITKIIKEENRFERS